MTIDDIHRFILFIIGKDTDGFQSPSEIDDALHRSQLDLFWKYAPVYGKDEESKNACDPFRLIYMVTPGNSPGGQVSLPSGLPQTDPRNYARLLSGMAISYDNVRGVQYRDIDFVNDDELAKRLSSQVTAVLYTWPIATTVGNGIIQLYPQQPNTAQFTYLGIPVPPLAAYTGSGRNLIYNPSGSTQLQWNESFNTKIISKALFYLGINLDDTEIITLMGQQAEAS